MKSKWLEEPIYIPKIRKRIVEKDFFIPKPGEHENVLEMNYTLPMLKQICREYKLPRTGSKEILTTYVFNYLRLYEEAVKIQAAFRGWLLRKWIRQRGCGFMKRSLCTNDTDFLSFEDVGQIPWQQFISFRDKDGFVFGFSMISLFQLFSRHKQKAENPYNRQPFPKEIVMCLKNNIKLSKILKIPVDVSFTFEMSDGTANLSGNTNVSGNNQQQQQEHQQEQEQQLQLRVLSLFQNMDALGNYTDQRWFDNLNHPLLIRFCRELMDIWFYRASLTTEVKQAICPPHGDPFGGIRHAVEMAGFSQIQQKRRIIGFMENMVNNGIDSAHKGLGAMYVLASLTLVSYEAREALPWLYQSVMH